MGRVEQYHHAFALSQSGSKTLPTLSQRGAAPPLVPSLKKKARVRVPSIAQCHRRSDFLKEAIRRRKTGSTAVNCLHSSLVSHPTLGGLKLEAIEVGSRICPIKRDPVKKRLDAARVFFGNLCLWRADGCGGFLPQIRTIDFIN